MATLQLDTRYLSSYLTLPEAALIGALDAPTVELVQTLLAKVAEKARGHEVVESENLKLGIELEHAVRSGESKTHLLKGSVEKNLKEIADLRQQLKIEGTGRKHHVCRDNPLTTDGQRIQGRLWNRSCKLSRHLARHLNLNSPLSKHELHPLKPPTATPYHCLRRKAQPMMT